MNKTKIETIGFSDALLMSMNLDSIQSSCEGLIERLILDRKLHDITYDGMLHYNSKVGFGNCGDGQGWYHRIVQTRLPG